MALTGTVFLVEDDPQTSSYLERLFRSAGLSVERFEDGVGLLSHHGSQPPACILLDVRLKGISGLELMQHLARRGRQVPVLVLTASREPHLRSRAFELGARAFLTKPVLESALVQALRAAQT